MGVWHYILGALVIVMAIIIILVIILQEGNTQGLGVVSGGADTFFAKNKARSIDAILARWTKFVAIFFVVAVVAINVLTKFVG